MTASEQSLWECLVELDRAAKAMSTGAARPNLLRLFDQIDMLSGQLPAETAPELLHYLRRKSYQKARMWLEGRDAQSSPGDCGH